MRMRRRRRRLFLPSNSPPQQIQGPLPPPPPGFPIHSPQIKSPLPPPRRSKRSLKRKTDDEDESPPQIEEEAPLPPRPPLEEEGRLKRRPPRKKTTTANQHQQQQDVPPILSTRPPCRSSSSSTLYCGGKRSRSSALSGRRDWSGLDDGPAGLIAELVLANDVADYIRFRAVCRPWRRCCVDPRTRAVLEDSRLHPRRWIMLLEAEAENLRPAAAPHCSRRRFLNVSTGQCIQVDIPELRDHGVLRSATEGLLLLLGKATGGAPRLLNPLTRQVAELPPLSGLHCSPGYSQSNAGLVDGGSRVVLYTHDGRDRTLAFAKPGDERWVLVKITDVLMSTMSFAGRFYGIAANNSTIMVVDMNTTRGEEEDLPPRLVVAAELSTTIRQMTDTAHLADNAGELMLVHRRMRRVRGADGEYNEHKKTYKVYRVNLGTGKTTPASARGCAIFIGFNRALSVSPQVFPPLSKNTVCPALGFDKMGLDQQISAYHLRDGSTESRNYDRSSLERPWSIADYLAAYVSG